MAEYGLIVGTSLNSAFNSLGQWTSQNDLLVTALGAGAIMIFACAILFRR